MTTITARNIKYKETGTKPILFGTVFVFEFSCQIYGRLLYPGVIKIQEETKV
jgi:hypothetical protein